jgi:hypothetical protein
LAIDVLSRFSSELKTGEGLTAETFLRGRPVEESAELRQRFSDSMLETRPLTGITNRSDKSPSPVPTADDAKAFSDGRRRFNAFDYIDEPCYWFLEEDDAALRQMFMGHGALTTLFLEPDSSGLPPRPDVSSMLAKYNVRLPKFLLNHPSSPALFSSNKIQDAVGLPPALMHHPSYRSMSASLRTSSTQGRAGALLSPFRDASKQVFGAKLKGDAKVAGTLFVLPRLQSQDFFSNTAEQVNRWFTVFDTYVSESLVDSGVIIASKKDRDPLLTSIIARMREEGLRYWEG